jgi:O-acetyl-ADP-ribose deacetylase (regulator of RNase III)
LLSDYNRKVCQVYCSALPISEWKYLPSENKEQIKQFAIKLLKYAFKCTLQVAVNKITVKNPRSTVYLTAVGGGVFGNNISWISVALIEALKDFKKYPLDVKMIWFNDFTGQLNENLNTEKIRSEIFKIKYLKYKKKYLNLKYLK